MIVFHVFGSFILTVLKYLKCIDCWESFKKRKTKPFELYYRGWHWSGMGQSFLQSFFFFFSYHFTILVQGPEIFFFIFCDIRHLLSLQELEAQLVRSDWRQKTALGEFSDDFLELPGSLRRKPFCNIGECGGLCFDQRFESILFLALWIHKNPEFCFLGKYCISGLKSPSESLEPEVTLSQAYNAHRLRLASVQPGLWLVHIRTHYVSQSVRTFR